MKFSCGRCGKRYATAETPAPGRVYKIRCKACGHLVVVRAEAALQATVEELGPGVMADLAAEQSVTAADLRSATFEIGAPEQHADTPHPAVPARPPPLPDPEPVLDDFPAPAVARGAAVPGAGAAISAVGLHAALAAEPSESAGPTPTPGYVDLFGDAARGEDESEPAPAGEASTDPFLAAARASLPDGHGDHGGPSPASVKLFRAPEREQGAVIAIPPRRKRTGPLVLIGAGALFLVGILAFVLLGGQPPEPPPPRIAVAPPTPAAPPIPVVPAPTAPAALAPEPAPAPAAAAQPAPATAVAVQPAVAEPQATEPRRAEKRPATVAGAREDRRAREREAAAAREARARQEREAAERDAAAKEARAREDREAQERERIAREARAREAREAQERERAERAKQEQQQVAAASLGEASEALTQDQVQKVLSSSRKAFDTCIANAGTSSGVALDGRRVMLRLNIQPTGSVTYPTLDDVTLNGTDLGSCLKSAARVMVFPRFKGDPMHVELPLVLAPAR